MMQTTPCLYDVARHLAMVAQTKAFRSFGRNYGLRVRRRICPFADGVVNGTV
jgi:hypothetical protein